ncbi:MAG: DUF4388 domain-containing protein [Cyanobacteria bacterium P01_G01_bin.38]
MTLQGYTSDVSLPALFKAFQESQKTGQLCLKPASKYRPKGNQDAQQYSFWFHRGNLIAATHRSDGRGLMKLIQQRVPLKAATLPRLLQRCPDQQPLGKFLKDNGVLTTRQLRSLFTHQILRYLCVLFQAPDVHFAFHPQAALPYSEMTNIKIPATEMMLPGLRALKNWNALQPKLPSPDSSLRKRRVNAPKIKLNTIEKEVLKIAEGGHSLAQIAKLTRQPTEDVLKIAFRLIFVGITEEAPYIRFTMTCERDTPSQPQNQSRLLEKLSHRFQKSPLSAPMSVKATH